MMTALSLRARVTAIVLIPLLTVSVLVGIWQLNAARETAADVFDRSLLSAALAVSGDVAISDGDALSARTRDILSDTSGGLVYYHVYAPDGVIVAGYATPPVGIPQSDGQIAQPVYFDARYLGNPVSGVRLQTLTEVDDYSGIFTTTVWQETRVRNAFVGDLITRTLATISALICSLAVIVWFGVRIGLRPLTDLQNAIEQRSSDELSPIRRTVPVEVRGIVSTLNALFQQVSGVMDAQAQFISNAAHQMRNPIAGVLSLTEAVRRAPDGEEMARRADDLLVAVQETADLGEKLLLHERASAISPATSFQPIDVGAAMALWAPDLRALAPDTVRVEIDVAKAVAPVFGDPTMLRETLVNLVDNAVRHGGAGLSRIVVKVVGDSDSVTFTVQDDGVGIAPDDQADALQRFSQIAASSGSGLGLSIADAVSGAHGGTLRLSDASPGLAVMMTLPAQSAL